MQIVTEAISQCIAFRMLVVKIRLVLCINNDLRFSKLQHYIWFKIVQQPIKVGSVSCVFGVAKHLPPQ